MKVIKNIIAYLCVILICIIIPTIPSIIIKGHIIEKMLLRQEESIKSRIPNMLLVAKPVDTEGIYSLMGMLSLYFIFIVTFEKLFLDDAFDWLGFLLLLLIGITYSSLTDVMVFCVRRAAGLIQGAVFFDPKDKRIYVFPSITSVYYKDYHESQLIYTTERYSKDDTAYVFFTRKDNNFAFKVDNLQYNSFEAILSQQEAIDMPIPFKHSFHTGIFNLITLAILLLGLFLILPLVVR